MHASPGPSPGAHLPLDRIGDSVTARVTTLKGPDAGAYYVEALPNYYLQSGEPRGRWHGRAASDLGLTGPVVDADFLALMAGEHPGRPGLPLGGGFTERSVRGFDVTCSAPKSVSVLFAVGDSDTRRGVLDAQDAAVEAVVEWIQRTALTRYRIAGQVAIVDAEGIAAAGFRQHTSRALDPQIHTHVVVANRVMSPDGRWLALDARGLKLDQRTVSAIYHASLQCELTRRLGVEWAETDHSIYELARIPGEVIAEFSQRTDSIRRRVDVKVDRFIDTMDRDPTVRERWRLEREAVIDSRPAKATSSNAAELHGEWTARLEALGFTVEELQLDCLDREMAIGLQPDVAETVIVDAVAALEDSQSSWRPAELTREIAKQLPTNIGHTPDQLLELLDTLTATAMDTHCVDISRPIPDEALVRRDGRPVCESVADRALTTQTILDQEGDVLAWAQRRLAYPGAHNSGALRQADRRLNATQGEAATAIAGTSDLVMVVGPAGTGKTTALTPAARTLSADRRHVFGVTPSAAAAQVLETETGIRADTLDKLLVEHDGRRPPGRQYDLPVGATVIVDEAGMVSTDKLAALAGLSDRRGWRVALVGDPLQFSAVGRGGMFAHLIDAHGAIELDQVHRFANDWERDASLRLRSGDQSVADVYDAHGRIHGGTLTRMESEALHAWATARRNSEAVLLSAPSNDTVARLNIAAQQARINAAEIDARFATVSVGGYRIHVGDEIVSRQNDRRILTDRGLMVRNRDTWTVTNIADGTLTATGDAGTVQLSAAYVSEHVQLAYAQTSHAAQGRTVDRSILVLDGPTDVRGLYVPLTRGRESNDVYIATTTTETAVDIFAASMARSWIDKPALARQAELADHRPGTIPTSDLQALFAERAEVLATLRGLEFDLPRLAGRIDNAQLVVDRATETVERKQGELDEATETLARLDRPLRRLGHRDEIRDTQRSIDRYSADLTDAQAKHTNAVAGLERARTDAAETRRLNQTRPSLEHRLESIDDTLNDDATIRAQQPSTAVIARLGERPGHEQTGNAWDRAAGRLDQHHQAFNPDQNYDRADFAASASRVNHAIDLFNREDERLHPTRHQSQDQGLGISR